MNGLDEIRKANDAVSVPWWSRVVHDVFRRELTPIGTSELTAEKVAVRVADMLAAIAEHAGEIMPADLAPLLDKAPGLREAMTQAAATCEMHASGDPRARDIAQGLRAWIAAAPPNRVATYIDTRERAARAALSEIFRGLIIDGHNATTIEAIVRDVLRNDSTWRGTRYG